jgi:Flp pilus assembly protein CpaB
MFRRKLPLGSKIYVAAALVCGALAFLVFRSEQARVQALVPKLGAPSPVVEAARSIARGSELSADELRVVNVPANFAPPGSISEVGSIVGRVAQSDIAEGELITATRLAPVRAGPVAALVPSDLRAFVINVSLPAEAVRAGDRVDVLATYAGGRPHSETVLSDVQILRVLTRPSPAGGGLPAASGGVAVTEPSVGSTQLVLLIDPGDSESLAYATTFGAISIAIEPAAPRTDPATPSPSSIGATLASPSSSH